MKLPSRKTMLVLRTWVLAGIGISFFMTLGFYLSQYAGFYMLSREVRPFHEAYSQFRSSGPVGLMTGLIAAGLFVLNMGYFVRKRLIRINWLGPLRMWMDLHVLTGLVGGGLILFHCALSVSSALGGLAVGTLGVTLITGIVGRSIYALVPRSLEGRELELKQVQDALADYQAELESAGLNAAWLIVPEVRLRDRQVGLVGCFISMMRGRAQLRRDYRRLRRQVKSATGLSEPNRRILPLAKEFCKHAQWLERYYDLRSLIASWRFFHRWLAILMFSAVGCHIVIAILYGSLRLGGVS